MSDWISVLSAFAIQVPVLLACIAALAIALSKPTLAPEVKKWALAGFGLALVLCFVAPAMQFFLLSSIRSGNTSRGVMISGGTKFGAARRLLPVSTGGDFGRPLCVSFR